jgi:glycosyltransferase involved in cell wall biosynthesis
VTAAAGDVVHFVVPVGFDDPLRATGGNVFDRHIARGLAAIGWDVRDVRVDPDAAHDAAAVLASLPDGALVLVDGLIAGRAPQAVEAVAERLRVVVIAHMVSTAFEDADARAIEGERRSLRSARCVITTSEWTRSELVGRGVVQPERVAVATPGSDDAPVANGTPSGAALLCVGVVAPHKGQDVLVEALAHLGADGDWTCTIAGSLDSEPAYAEHVAMMAQDAGLGARITMTGALTGSRLESAYRGADLVVAPSRVESYGMAITDALRRGIPVVASSVGGIPQTVESRAAVLVPPNRPRALGEALRRWMADPEMRERLTQQARSDRADIPPWSVTVDRVAATLAGVR